MAQYEVNNCSIQTLLSWIQSGEVAIPEIQRPFVWDSTKVRDLIDSLYAGFPVGFIVIWKNPDIRLKDGSISQGRKILIDGQQRLTALQAAIVGDPVLNSSYKRKHIKIAFHPLEERFEVANSAIAKDSSWIQDIAPFYVGGFDSLSFVLEYCDKNQLAITTRTAVNAAISRLQQIQNNNIGVIELSPQLDISQVTEIFIRINSRGVVLSQADFAMSKIASDERFDGNTIRKTVDYFCHLKQKPGDYEAICDIDRDFTASEDFARLRWIIDEHEDIYEPDYADVLRVAFTFRFLRGRISELVSLLSGRDFEARDFLDHVAEQSFASLREGVQAFVSRTNFQRYLMIVKSTGIISPSLIRSQNVLNFGYALFLLLRDKGTPAAIIEKIVRRWIVLCILTGRYSGSPESKFDYDIKRFHDNDPMDFLEQTEAGELSDAFWELTLVTRLKTSVANSPMFQLFLMAQVKMGDYGFLSEQIDVKSLIEQRGDIHHIFPKKYLQKCGIRDSRKYNQVANYVYTQSEINIEIRDQAPKDYMHKVLEQCSGGAVQYGGINSLDKLRANLQSHCIPEGFETMDIADYENFLEHRRQLMAAKIRSYYQSLR